MVVQKPVYSSHNLEATQANIKKVEIMQLHYGARQSEVALKQCLSIAVFARVFKIITRKFGQPLFKIFNFMLTYIHTYTHTDTCICLCISEANSLIWMDAGANFLI